MSDGFCDLLAAAALEAMGVDHDDVEKILDASVTQDLCTLADELCWIDIRDVRDPDDREPA